MTLRETIALLRQKTEGFRFYILRFLRVFFLYKLFVVNKILAECLIILYYGTYF